MRRYGRLAGAALLVALVAGCATSPGPKTTIGGLGGAAGGGLLAASLSGGDPAITAAGTILGLLVGGAIGDRLDANDRRYAQAAMHQALEQAPMGQQVPWQNPATGRAGWVAPIRTYTQPVYGSPGQHTCREYHTSVMIGGREERAAGVACRDSAGEWRIANR
jgi:surface antigen